MTPRRHVARKLAGVLVQLGIVASCNDLAGQDSTADSVQAARRRVWIRPVASLVVPGSGQLFARQDRGAVFLAAELYVVSRYLQLSHEGRNEARRFRALALAVARRTFAAMRRDTVFEYYEQMQRFVESGEFDRDPGPALAPETDPTTYNGSVWLLARRTYWQDPDSLPSPWSPEYAQAVQFYLGRAVGPEFRWSWRDAPLEHEVFRQSIARSDGAFRRAQIQLGLLLANHVASAVDALVSQRLAAALDRPAAVETSWLPGGPTVVAVRIGF